MPERGVPAGSTLLSGGCGWNWAPPCLSPHFFPADPATESLCIFLLFLTAVDWANLLAVTDQPMATSGGGGGFGRRVLQDFQLLHGRLPPLLVRYLLGGEPEGCGGGKGVCCDAIFGCAVWRGR